VAHCLLRSSAVIVSATSVLLLAGCNVTTEKHANGDNVDISTPFGSVKVKTDGDGKGNAVGLAIYPGSIQIREDHNSGSADISMNFGDFHLGVQAADYKTKDDSEKVISFYRKDMARYGVVIECRDNHVVGKPERTQDGLGCDEQKGSNSTNGELQLLAGSPAHQHIVAIADKDGSTRIGLVSLNLPKEINHHSEKESE
jgi:hypothetical protein